MTNSQGYDELLYPKPNHLTLHRDFMLKYFQHYEEIKHDLGAILSKIAKNNTVIVATVNKGQSELMTNFVCNARSGGFDISNLIIFPTDDFSDGLAKSMGIATFFHKKVCPLAVSDSMGGGIYGKTSHAGFFFLESNSSWQPSRVRSRLDMVIECLALS